MSMDWLENGQENMFFFFFTIFTFDGGFLWFSIFRLGWLPQIDAFGAWSNFSNWDGSWLVRQQVRESSLSGGYDPVITC